MTYYTITHTTALGRRLMRLCNVLCMVAFYTVCYAKSAPRSGKSARCIVLTEIYSNGQISNKFALCKALTPLTPKYQLISNLSIPRNLYALC